MLRSRLTYFIVLLGSLTFYFCFNGYISTYVLLAVLSLPLCSLLLALPGLLGLRAELSLPSHAAQKGTEFPVRLTIVNRLPLVSGQASAVLSVRNTLTGEEQSERIFFTAGPRPLRISHDLQSGSCGQVVCTLSKGRFYDYMGLFVLPFRLSKKSAVLFYPTVYKPALLTEQTVMPDSEGERYSKERPGSDPSELFDLREYREGDRIAQIHWKLSQKTGTTLVREFGLPLSDQLLFLLDVNGAGAEADALLDAFATLSAFLSERSVPHRVGFRDRTGRFSLRELFEPEDSRLVLGEILMTGLRMEPLLSEEDALPLGVAHSVYLCCTPEGDVLSLLRHQMPSARISILSAGPIKGSDLPDGCEVTDIGPGRLPDALNGFRL